jgi:hypothetical protein
LRPFTKQKLDELFAVDNWDKYYKETLVPYVHKKLRMNMNDWEKKPDLYNWMIYPLVTKEDDLFYRCTLHSTVTTGEGKNFKGVKQVTMFYRTIYFSEFISHCIQYHAEEHKAFIESKLFKGSNVTTTETNK